MSCLFLNVETCCHWWLTRRSFGFCSECFLHDKVVGRRSWATCCSRLVCWPISLRPAASSACLFGPKGHVVWQRKGHGGGGVWRRWSRPGWDSFSFFLRKCFQCWLFMLFSFLFSSHLNELVYHVLWLFFVLGLTNRCLFCIQHSFIFLRDDHLAFGGVGTEDRV